MGLNKITGTVTAKIMAFTAVLFLVLLTASLIHSHLGANSLAEEFTTENGMLTPTLKIRRRAVTDKYGAEIEDLYKKGGKAAA